jgi:hypothetical protein
MNDVIGDALYTRLFDEAERVRWELADIPWDRIARDAVTPELCELVREIAYSELTTTTATRRFLTELSDDVDFTQWISVWFYEETKHPQALLRWLRHVGWTVDERFVLRGRATAPFMKSKIGTLVTNIISEMAASSAYANLAARAHEPVLTTIATHLAADEARHAASFYSYARRYLERSAERDADRRDAQKVLYLWLDGNSHVQHPVNEFYVRNAAALQKLKFEPELPRARIVQLVATLLDVQLSADGDLLASLRAEGVVG